MSNGTWIMILGSNAWTYSSSTSIESILESSRNSLDNYPTYIYIMSGILYHLSSPTSPSRLMAYLLYTPAVPQSHSVGVLCSR